MKRPDEIHLAAQPMLENTVLRESVSDLIATEAFFSVGDVMQGPGMHTHARIILMEIGTVSFHGKAEPFILSAGDVAVLPMGWKYGSLVHHAGRKERCLRFTGSLARSISDIPGPVVFGHTERALRRVIEVAINAVFEKKFGWDWLFLEAVAAAGRVLKSNTSTTLCQQVEQLLLDEPGYRWSVTEVANALCISESSLAHRFKEEVGVPPARWIRSYRVGQAKELLRVYRPSQVASMLGFADQFHFSRVFRQDVGIPPSTWRDRVLSDPYV